MFHSYVYFSEEWVMEEEPEVVAEVTEQFLQTATPGDGFVEIQTVDFDVVPGEAQIIGQVRMRDFFTQPLNQRYHGYRAYSFFNIFY